MNLVMAGIQTKFFVTKTLTNKVIFYLVFLPLGPSVASEYSCKQKEEKHDQHPQQPVNQGEVPVKEYLATEHKKTHVATKILKLKLPVKDVADSMD